MLVDAQKDQKGINQGEAKKAEESAITKKLRLMNQRRPTAGSTSEALGNGSIANMAPLTKKKIAGRQNTYERLDAYYPAS